MTEVPDLRERTRRAVAAELTAAALKLFAEQGFESTTVDQIATAAGISRRSFFRYFTTKDDVLLQSMGAVGDSAAADLTARPADEPAWTALRRSFDGLIDSAQTNPESTTALLDMMLTSPALNAAHLAKQAAWQLLLAQVLHQRSANAGHEPVDQLTELALAGAAVACFEAAQITWVRSCAPGTSTPTTTLDALLDRAMGAIQPLTASRSPAPTFGCGGAAPATRPTSTRSDRV